MKRNREVPSQYLELLKEYKADEKRIKREEPEDLTPEPPLPLVHQASNPDQSTLVESSDEDEWDDVELEEPLDIDVHDVELNFQKPESQKKDTMARSLKLQIHTSYFALMLAHTRTRNFWIQDRQLRLTLRNFLPSVILQLLIPPQHLSPTLKTKTLLQGLMQAVNWWRTKFRTDNIGLYMVNWRNVNDKSRQVQGPLTKQDFITDAMKTRGSIDQSGQVFCALLRAHGLECRLVSSIQPPDFMNQGGTLKSTGQTTSIYPLYWTEVWDDNEQQWITVDPTTKTVQILRRDSPLEPPQNDTSNMLRYCIAWFQDGTARDVTRRYTTKYSARVRKKRMDYVPRYAKLYNQLMARFAPKTLATRDIREYKDLQRHVKNEGIPSRVQDFIGHPVYCLEHQLKKTEILEPKKSCGTLFLKGEVIPIYSRANVKQCRSAQSWYREGRVLLTGVQPKRYRSKRDKLTGVEEKVALYTWEQTKWYKPQPVVNGIVPKTEYRTIDIFTPLMIPLGGVHITHPLSQRAAKFMGIDFANAVVSVEFQHGSGPKSKYNGIVVAKEFEEAVYEVIKGVQKQAKVEAKRANSVKMLSLWKQFIVAAQIRRRVDGNDMGFEVSDKEPWPLHLDNTQSELFHVNESSSESEDGALEVNRINVIEKEVSAQDVKREENHSSVLTTEQSKAPAGVQVPINELIHKTHEESSSPKTTKKSPTHSDFEDDGEYPDMMLDGLNESDFDV